MKKIVFLLLLMIPFTLASAQESTEGDSYEQESNEDSNDETYEGGSVHYTIDPEKVSDAKGYSDERIEVKRFDQKKWEEVVAGHDYSEIQKKTKRNKTNSDDKASAGDKRSGNSDEGDDEEEDETTFSFSAPIASPVVTIIFYAIVGCIICYILFLIIKNTSIKSNPNPKKHEAGNVVAVVDDIQELEIDKLLREALNAGNYRLAIRIYFLGILKKLDEDGIILWKKDKTNRDYLSELFKKAYHYEDVSKLTLLYEEVWYGEHSFSHQAYQDIIAAFSAMNQKLNIAKDRENGK